MNRTLLAAAAFIGCAQESELDSGQLDSGTLLPAAAEHDPAAAQCIQDGAAEINSAALMIVTPSSLDCDTAGCELTLTPRSNGLTPPKFIWEDHEGNTVFGDWHSGPNGEIILTPSSIQATEHTLHARVVDGGTCRSTAEFLGCPDSAITAAGVDLSACSSVQSQTLIYPYEI